MASYCCYPCKLCAKACESVGRCMGAGCQGCNDCASEGCCPVRRPSPIFLMFTALFNAPSGIAAMVIGFANLSNGCKEPLHVFLLVQAFVFNLFMILFAVRLYQQFSQPYLEDSPPRRAGRMCWRDPVVCLKFLAAPCALAVSITGLVWAGEAGPQCPQQMKDMTIWSSVLMLIYLGTGWLVMLVSLCVECGRFSAARCDERYMGRYTGHGEAQPPPSAPGAQQPPVQHPPIEPNAFQKLGSDVGHFFYPTAPPYYEVEAGLPHTVQGQGAVQYPPIYGQPAVGIPVSQGGETSYVPPPQSSAPLSSHKDGKGKAANKV
mmetsp:Transcript_5512/g.13968  ORF Transcript_5512/g.13968 Transcript_5512/m.13968 type:complete len:319 (+) Transcript_5512:237-1193(+)